MSIHCRKVGDISCKNSNSQISHRLFLLLCAPQGEFIFSCIFILMGGGKSLTPQTCYARLFHSFLRGLCTYKDEGDTYQNKENVSLIKAAF